MNIFFFAHQDDEFSCFYEIQRLCLQGLDVSVFYLTSGSDSLKTSKLRNSESISVLTKLGMKKENIFFIGTSLNIKDGYLIFNLKKVFYSLLKYLRPKSKKINKVYFHTWEGGHADHDAVHLIGLALIKKLNLINRSFLFSTYNGRDRQWLFFRLFDYFPCNGKIESKKIPILNRFFYLRLCFNYHSQLKTWLILYPALIYKYIFDGTQSLQRVRFPKALLSPYNGLTYYEKRKKFKFDKFCKEANNFFNEFVDLSRRKI